MKIFVSKSKFKYILFYNLINIKFTNKNLGKNYIDNLIFITGMQNVKQISDISKLPYNFVFFVTY
jgi:hypothetical protein